MGGYETAAHLTGLYPDWWEITSLKACKLARNPMPEVTKDKWLTTAGWDDVPHLSKDKMAQMLAGTMPFLRDARSKGIPSLGAGAIYPIPESEFTVKPFAIPKFWPKSYALDVGWNRTACLWGAYDRASDCIYIFTEHYRAHALPSVHAAAIHARGEWIEGVIDPAARGRSQKDGEQLLVTYEDLGLNISPAINAVEAGLYGVWERLTTGRIKVFSTCQHFFNEYRLYRRNEKGVIVKKNDHLMDCARYLVANCPDGFILEPPKVKNTQQYVGGDDHAGY